MPQPGERKTVNGVTGEWDGQTWRQVSSPSPASDSSSSIASLLGYIPGLKDVANLPSNIVKGVQALPDVARGMYNNPGATAKGFVQGASDAATPDRVGLLSLLTGGATLPAALAAAGGESAAKVGQVASGSPNAPQSFPQAALQVGGAATVPGLPAGIGAATRGIRSVIPSANGAGVTGALLGGYEGYKHGGLLGAAEGAGAGYLVGNKASKLSRILEGLSSKGEGAAAAAEDIPSAVKNPGTPAEAPVGLEYPESWKPFIKREQVSSEVAAEPEEGWGAPETPTRPTASSDQSGRSIIGSPAMEGLKQSVSNYRNSLTTRAMTNPAIESSYNRGTPGQPLYSDEAFQWLKAHTPQQPAQDFMESDVLGKDRTTGDVESLGEIANRFRLAKQGLLSQP